ncbi:hypothetical protein Phou_043700 [Phytohabitans houttuyneae]|uniref:L-aspartate oxidase n=1 Tax=Phytohabitans houttuyneae TaxID=1076126 RepID=A0A6V8K9T9_9ACTN|nr:hypothetical protein Phou_043700 [Phytohabitans houttuyneae]
MVAKAIHRVMLASGADHVYLDARHLPDVPHRFPTITAACLAAGIDPTVDLIPVAPAAHYASGGVRTDLRGRSSIPGLYACGEVACTGVHGANRLASNSLLEGLVFARRIAEDVARDLPPQAEPAPLSGEPGWVVGEDVRVPLQEAMTRGAGVLRSADSLATAAKELTRLGGTRGTPRTASWEATNLLTVASTLVAAAYTRQETRGCHWREDYPATSDEWLGHLLGGSVRTARSLRAGGSCEPVHCAGPACGRHRPRGRGARGAHRARRGSRPFPPGRDQRRDDPGQPAEQR